MGRAVVDTTVLLAFLDPDDDHHDRGRDIVRGIDHGHLPGGHVTEAASVETFNDLQRNAGHDVAVRFLDRLLEGSQFTLVYSPQVVYSAARAIFRQYDALSMGDAMQVAYMQEAEGEYIYSFDSGFDTVDGVARLNSAVNPFEADES